ncbi:laccase [Guyanagaster necrorhizus]|uniref:laccase n=1 Tax=Guyanagaster necrorhizus TaxID=856835 RepID=A0A9P7VN69_9AGAR|nr:laccase [Guyanagaster necrorhizus MCA 3950]KAG7443717.1 laccase [Guyanagaster necrorhizus MCA 3950]
MVSPLFYLLTLTLLLSCSRALRQGTIGPVGDLVISNGNVNPDGFERLAALANSQIDGTLIRGNKGDTFKINVVNRLNNNTILQSTSIHWHGLFQKGTGWADGPAFVDQCPIVKGDSFLYTFNPINQAGTFWYHSHLATQYCDGLRGPLVIYDPNDPHADLYDVDDDSTSILTLSDWYHTPAKQLTFPTLDAVLINGMGRWSGNPTHDLAVVNVTQGTRYRIRMVNIGCDAAYTVSIDSHLMTIIEADGVNLVPYTVDGIQIFAAQRYSFVLNANQPIGNYWIRANPSVGTQGFSGGINSAILRYNGANNVEPDILNITSVLSMNETQMTPLENPGAPGSPEIGGVDVALNLVFAFTSAGTFTINGVQFIPPTTPVLLQILSGAENVNDILPEGSIYALPLNSTIEISMPGGVIGGGHPFHLHGHNFDVVRSAGSTVYNYVNPVRRDVVNIGTTGDNVTIRFTTDNPGPWFLHCHIDWHLQAGFAIVFAEATERWNSTIHPTGQWDDLCPTYDATPSEDL